MFWRVVQKRIHEYHKIFKQTFSGHDDRSLKRHLNFHIQTQLERCSKRIRSRIRSVVRFLLYNIIKEKCLQCLTGRQEKHPTCKNWVMRCWCGYLSGARCRLSAYDQAHATVSKNPIISCLIKIQTGFTFVIGFMVPAYPGYPGKRPLNGCSSSSSNSIS